MIDQAALNSDKLVEEDVTWADRKVMMFTQRPAIAGGASGLVRKAQAVVLTEVSRGT